MVAQFSTPSEDASRFVTIYQTVLAAYEALGYPAAIVNTWAIGPHDAPDLLTVAQKAKPEKILEVGTYVGVSTMLLALACPRAHIFTVDPDLPLEIEMGATGSSVANVDSMATTHAIARAAAEKLGVADRITFVKGGFAVRETFSSTLTSSGSKVKLAGPKLCKDEGPFDFVFIDGLHTSEAVAADLQLGAKHLAASGVMVLHDCVGFWGANVRAGVMEFIRRDPSYRFVHPPFSDLWRSVGIVARSGSKAIDRSQFAAPMTAEGYSDALRETFGALISTSFGQRDVLEVSVGDPLLKEVAPSGRHVSVRVLSMRGRHNLNAELDRILTQFDKLEAPVLFSADLLDFAPTELVQNLLAAVAHRKGALMFAVTPPGEAGVAGPESRPAGWLVDLARAYGFAAYAPPLLDLEPARYSLLPEMRELGRNSRLTSSIIVASRGGFVDAKRRKLSELTSALAAEREQTELQRVHLASGYRRFFGESQTKSDLLQEQSQQLHEQIHTALEAAQREKGWREENNELLTNQIDRLTKEYRSASERVQALAAEVAARDVAIAELTRKLNDTAQDGGQSRSLLDSLAAESRAREAALAELSTQLQTALEAGQREKGWREEAAALHQVEVAKLLEQYRGVLARESALRAQNEASLELALLESELRAEKEARLRKMIDDLTAGHRERDADLSRAIEVKAALEIELARVGEERRAAIVREASLQDQLRSHLELTRFELEARDERERSLWNNLQQLADAERRGAVIRAAVDAAALEARAQQDAIIEGLRVELTEERALRAASDAAGQESQARLDAIVEGLRVELAEERALRAASDAAGQESQARLDAIVEGLRVELAEERALRAETEARAQEGRAIVSELSARLDTMMNTTQSEDAGTREELMRLAERLNEIRAESDDYLVRLVDVYHAMDSFDVLVSAGEASLSDFERDVLGMHAAQPDLPPARPETGEDLDAANTIAEIERLKARWRNVLSRLGRSVLAGADRVHQLEQQVEASRTDGISMLAALEARLTEAEQRLESELAVANATFQWQLAQERSEAEQRFAAADAAARQQLAAIETDAALRLAEFEAAFRRQHAESLEASAQTERELVESQAFLESQLAELRGVLETRSSEGQDVAARLSALSAQNAEFTQRLIDVYQALDEIDAAIIDQLRMCSETEAQLLGTPGDADPAAQDDDTQDHLILLRQRSRALSARIARLLMASESRFLTTEEVSLNLRSHASALETQVRAIRSSTSWRAMAPVRFAGKPVRVLRRRAGARMRGQELLKLKAELDNRLKPLGLTCPVFDAHGYAQRYGDVPAERALRHYLSFGENEGRSPLATFDPGFYYRMYPDVQTARASALLHFLKFGIHEGRSPCAALHPLGQLAAERGVSTLELFARS